MKHFCIQYDFNYDVISKPPLENIFSPVQKCWNGKTVFATTESGLIEAIQNLFWKLNFPAPVAHIRGDSL